ncbi:procollagen-lysine,2-oxoglutarate 5-dioxygenase isoform X2 [Venturia canescens]|uniref:procollagen-lysine,2-oxoglutarate 5-dioxygenase isoform X2 n=1 Tax=Venturia canescens TaxID=32260 RepID=UPI001C9C637A|nr:procollagen-lysine,2-oxoglutarate 5-dioxygenase isoform X2 [Venturia canescens]
MKGLGLLSVFVLWYFVGHVTTSTGDADTLILTVASNETDGFKRYIRSARVYGIVDNIKVLGMGKAWKGGSMLSTGGGYKIRLLKQELSAYKDDREKIVLFTDGYDVIFLSSLDEIIKKFKSFDARILFSSEASIWPDKSLADKYPSVSRGTPYLNSGGFIAYASDLYELIHRVEVADNDDDQLFFTKLYLDPMIRKHFHWKLDHRSEIFQNLYGVTADVALNFKSGQAYLRNSAYDTTPLIVHGNGLSKLALNSLGNYLARGWTEKDGCLSCWDDTIELPKDKPESWPTIVMGIFVDVATPFLEEFLDKIRLLSYPKSKIHLFTYVDVAYHEEIVEKFVTEHGKKYASVKKIVPGDSVQNSHARHLAMDYCLLKNCGAFFHVDSASHLDNKHTLKLLVEQQRSIVGPMLVRSGSTWSNFWTAIADNGYYARGFDYMEIVENKRRGLWNVPYLTHCYLVNATILKNPSTKPSYSDGDLDFDMAFAQSNRKHDVFMFVSNRLDFGHLVNYDNFNTQLTNPEMYEIFNNKYDWEERYIHDNYSAIFEDGYKPMQPCPDVYWFPVTTERFTKDLISLVESYGKWSDGSNNDPRIEGGYENVPTRDIHMKQVSFEPHWLRFLRDYVRPLQELVFTGYLHDPPHSLLNFVVRYKPDEQPSLRPHHDASTYTINLALNQVGKDYEGGGCRFIRYNCSVTDTKPGWMLMHPGRLTHYHEGLPVKKGTRYIMISFIDP